MGIFLIVTAILLAIAVPRYLEIYSQKQFNLAEEAVAVSDSNGALASLGKAMRLCPAHRTLRCLGNASYTMGNVNALNKNMEAAIFNFRKSSVLFKKADYAPGELDALYRLGRILFLEEEYRQAIDALNQALLVQEKVAGGPGNEAIKGMLESATIRLSMPESPQKRLMMNKKRCTVLYQIGREAEAAACIRENQINP